MRKLPEAMPADGSCCARVAHFADFAAGRHGRPGGFVYFMRRSDGLIKIGYSKAPEARLSGVSSEIFRATGVRMPVAVLAAVPGDRNDEAQFHLRFLEHRLSGEWFSPVPELLSLIAEIQAQGGAK